MAVVLDGSTYKVHQVAYLHEQEKYANIIPAILGDKIRIEGGAFTGTFPLTLICTTTDVANLRTSYAKVSTAGTPPANLLSFTSEEGITYDPATGSDTPTHKFSTGVWFDCPNKKLTPKPMAPTGYTAGNRFLVDVILTVNSKVLATL